MATITAAQLKSMASHYDSLVVDASACVGAKEIDNWILTAERVIDGYVRVLESGTVSKRNEALKVQLSASYKRLAAKIAQMEHNLKALPKLALVK